MSTQQETSNGLHIPSLFVGIAAGIAGTILYATYREREFNRIVSKTRELSDQSGQYVGDIGQSLKDRAASMVDSAEHAVTNLSQTVHHMADKGRNSST